MKDNNNEREKQKAGQPNRKPPPLTNQTDKFPPSLFRKAAGSWLSSTMTDSPLPISPNFKTRQALSKAKRCNPNPNPPTL
ncbi:hypothetical protein VTJ04DRAFT_9212 [Mycothermus thermophilus]|uniref:uncharacterized protein n=1 Tax=Humicola insolens TaxID=85995 RepID=UPI0037442620